MRHLFRPHQYYNNNKLLQLVFIKDVICQCFSKVNKNDVRQCGFKDLYYNKSSRMTSEISVLDQRMWNISKRKDIIYSGFTDSNRVWRVDLIITFNASAFKMDYSESSSVRNINLRWLSHTHHLRIIFHHPFREASQDSNDDYPHKISLNLVSYWGIEPYP